MFNRTNNVKEVFSANDATAVTPEVGLSKREKLQVAGIAGGMTLAVNLGVWLIGGQGVSALSAKRAAAKSAKEEKPTA